ncbi:MAG: hypothetical protein M1434_00950 [Chloroflexi bacterium]|nr:hypothetical protein [Chloroflexota bacterium]
MCRFLLLHTDGAFDPAALFLSFAEACRCSRSVDDAGQSDGWGIAWLGADDTWALHKRLTPIWEDAGWLAHPPRSRAYALHARSASFEKDRVNLAYNQPYLYPADATRAPGLPAAHPYAYTFNGLLRGVSLPRRVEGQVGAQRIWNLLRDELAVRPPAEALGNTAALLRAHTRELVACNIGLIDAQHLYASCQYTRAPEYYQLRWYAGAGMRGAGMRGAGLRMVCSEPLPGYTFNDVPVGNVFTL